MIDVITTAPPAVESPDGTHQIFNNGSSVTIRNIVNDSEYVVNTQGVTPGLNSDNTRLVWVTRSGATIPGQSQPNSVVWVSNIDGSDTREIVSGQGLSASWLDNDRLLIRISNEGRLTTLSVLDVRDSSAFQIGTWRNIRNLSIAPGGGHLMFYVTWQDNPADDGIYVVGTTPNATPQKLSWFGAWRWRDSTSVYYLPFTPESQNHSLAYYNIISGENRLLVTPDELQFTVMNGDWDVSVDGRRIVFQNALDQNMWLLEITD